MDLEITSVENGYLILEGNSLGHSPRDQFKRRMWVAIDSDDLAVVVSRLAEEHEESIKNKAIND
jgi:helix-turn-helix protein